MKKLTITEIDNYDYHLKDKNNKIYKLNLEFQKVDMCIDVGDIIFINEKLLDSNYKEYSKSYCFGPLNSIYGRKIEDSDNPDILAVKLKNKTIYLQRYYG